jgi:hypothetical protein
MNFPFIVPLDITFTTSINHLHALINKGRAASCSGFNFVNLYHNAVYTAIGGECHAQFLMTNSVLTTISPD